jgi:hypothetical protein
MEFHRQGTGLQLRSLVKSTGELELTLVRALPRPQLLANLCHRDKDYGNWNKNEPVFKIPVFIYLTRKHHPHRFKTPKGSDGQSSTYQTPRQDIKKNLMKAWHFLHVSSAIIGKHRQRSDVTGITTSSHHQISVASTSYQPNLETPTSNAGAGCGRLILAILDKASIQPQQTSDHQTNIVQQVMSTGGELHGQSNANKKHPNANTLLTESLR